MFSACFQISTISGSLKKKISDFHPWKSTSPVTIKISKKSEDQNGCTTLKFYSAPHSISEVTINAEGGWRFSPNIFPTSSYFQHRGIPEVDLILHTYWQPPPSLNFSFICLSSLPLSPQKIVFYFLLSTTSFGKEFQRSVTCFMSNSSVLSMTPSSFLWCLLIFCWTANYQSSLSFLASLDSVVP